MNTHQFVRFSCLLAFGIAASGCASSGGARGPSRPLELPALDGAQPDATRFYHLMGLAASHAPVAFVGKAAYFATGSSDSTLTLISVSLPNRALTFVREGDLYRAPYAVQLRLKQGGAELRRFDALDLVRVGTFRETTRTDESVIFQQYLRLAPGSYVLNLSVRDAGSARTSADSLVLTVPRLGSGHVSSALPVYEIRARMSLDSTPQMVPSPRSTAVFGRDSVIAVYIEAYGNAAALPLRIIVRNEGGAVMWTDSSTIHRRGSLLSGAIGIPVARIGVGVASVVFSRTDTRDSSMTPVFVSFGDDLPVAPFDDMLAYLRFFTSASRISALRRASPESRAQMWADFLRSTDPDPNTAEHEGLREYFGRIQLANARFQAEGTAGWLSDRGMVYVSLGEPDQAYEQNVSRRGRPTLRIQVWEYREYRLQLVFTDEMQPGRWRLTPSGEADFRAANTRRLAM